MPYFVYQTPTHIQIEAKPIRNLGELLRTFQDLLACRAWVKKVYPKATIKDDIRIRRKPFLSKAVRLIMSRKKRGKLNPNAKGLSEEYKAKIKRTMTGQRRGEKNTMFGRKHTASTRLKLSIARRKRKGWKWCIDLNGKNHQMPANSELPYGWVWGVKQDRSSW